MNIKIHWTRQRARSKEESVDARLALSFSLGLPKAGKAVHARARALYEDVGSEVANARA